MTRRTRTKDDRGFTLIELLVVMIIIGILAGIAIPALLSQKRKAYETSAKSDVKAIAKEVVGYYVDSSGALTLAAGSAAGTWELKSGATVIATGNFSKGNSVGRSTIASDSAYCVAVAPAYTGARAWHADQTGLVVNDCP